MVELDDHHDSAIINAGLAADAGYRGTFGHEADESLDELRETFRRKAHTAAMERCLTAIAAGRSSRTEASVGAVTLGDLPDDATTTASCADAARIVHSARRLVWSTTSAGAMHPTRCRWRCAAPGRPGSPSTATPTSAAACWAPATAPNHPVRPLSAVAVPN